jgi:hypothetical protein
LISNKLKVINVMWHGKKAVNGGFCNSCDLHYLCYTKHKCGSKGTFGFMQWIQMVIGLKEHRKQQFPIILYSYGNLKLTTYKRRDQFRSFKSMIQH